MLSGSSDMTSGIHVGTGEETIHTTSRSVNLGYGKLSMNLYVHKKTQINAKECTSF